MSYELTLAVNACPAEPAHELSVGCVRAPAMPTVAHIEGYRFHFFANEGPRPHIHVSKGGGAAKVWLDDLSMADWDNLTGAQRRRILTLVEENRQLFQDAWNEFFTS